MKYDEKKLGELLVKNSKITEKDLKKAQEYQKNNNLRIGEALVELGFITYDDLMDAISLQISVPRIDLHKTIIDERTIDLVDSNMAKRFSVIPIKLIENKLKIVMLDPLDIVAIDELERSTGFIMDPLIASPQEIEKLLDQYYGIKDSVDKVIKSLENAADIEKEILEINKLKEIVDDAPIVRVVNAIIEQAIKDGASDIHLEPGVEKLIIRFRVDGVLRDIMSSPKNSQAVIISRLKIMANMNIAERRLPQDSRFRTKVGGREIDVRVSTLPTIYGEKMVLRILDTSSLILDINKLGMSEYNAKIFKKIISNPSGIFLLTGPTGCGKTTTLYSLLSYFNSRDKNIVTIEDPVEYRLPGINQVNVISKIGLDFAEGLRSILRQDPDIIMVGEIRDRETAEIAIRAALTGHVVLSTLHTNDATGAINRLIDMGLPPFLVVSAVKGIMAQRLVRKTCTSCGGEGCAKCSNTRYKGRLAIHEILYIDDEISKAIMNKISTKELRNLAIKKGMITLYNDGLARVKEKVTTYEELMKVTCEEEI